MASEKFGGVDSGYEIDFRPFRESFKSYDLLLSCMKNFFLIFILALFLGLSSGSHQGEMEFFNCYENKMCNLSESHEDFEGIKEVSESGISWNATLDIRDVEFTKDFSEKVENVSTIYNEEGEGILTFDGVLKTGGACEVPDLEVVEEKKYREYVINVSQRESTAECAVHTTRIEYTLKFVQSGDFKADINQRNITREVETPDYALAGGTPSDQGGGPETDGERENEEVADNSDSTPWFEKYMRDFVKLIPW